MAKRIGHKSCQSNYIETYIKSVDFETHELYTETNQLKTESWRNSLIKKPSLHQCNLQRYGTGKRLFSFKNSQTTEDKCCHLLKNLRHFFGHSFDIIICQITICNSTIHLFPTRKKCCFWYIAENEYRFYVDWYKFAYILTFISLIS